MYCAITNEVIGNKKDKYTVCRGNCDDCLKYIEAVKKEKKENEVNTK